MTRETRWIALGGLLLTGWPLLAAPRAVAGAAAANVVVSGQVKDAQGEVVPGLTLRIIKTRRIRSVSHPKSRPQEVEETRGRTDGEGRYRLELSVDPSFPFYFVRFYDPKTFDTVKYQLPPDLDISRGVESGGAVQASALLQMQADWPQVKALVDEYGPASQRGQIIRSLGLPTRRSSAGEGRELWEFDAAGVSYVLQGDQVIETRRTKTPEGDAVAPVVATPPSSDGNPP